MATNQVTCLFGEKAPRRDTRSKICTSVVALVDHEVDPFRIPWLLHRIVRPNEWPAMPSPYSSHHDTSSFLRLASLHRR